MADDTSVTNPKGDDIMDLTKMTEKQFKAAAGELIDSLDRCQFDLDTFKVTREDGLVILAGAKIKAAYDVKTAKLSIQEGKKEIAKHEQTRLEVICNNWHGSLE